MDEKMKKVIDRQQAFGKDLAEKQVDVAIGQAVLSLVGRGEKLTLDSLVKTLAQQVAHLPVEDFLRHRNETALAALRDAFPSTP